MRHGSSTCRVWAHGYAGGMERTRAQRWGAHVQDVPSQDFARVTSTHQYYLHRHTSPDSQADFLDVLITLLAARWPATASWADLIRRALLTCNLTCNLCLSCSLPQPRQYSTGVIAVKPEHWNFNIEHHHCIVDSLIPMLKTSLSEDEFFDIDKSLISGHNDTEVENFDNGDSSIS
jgi:hypothetical protein